MSASSKTRTLTNSPTSGHSARPSGTRTPSQGRVSSSTSFQGESPTKSEPKKIPPIKAPVGLARGPDLKNVRSKIGSLDNVKHRPAGGEKKVETQKLEWNAKSRVGSLENANRKPMGGDVRVRTQKLEWKVTSKVGSLDNVKHQPGGGTVKIFDEKYAKGAKTPSPATTPTPGSKSGSFSNGKPSFDGHNTSSIESPTPAPANRTANSRKLVNSTGTSAGTRTNSTSESNSATNEITAKMNSVNLTTLRT